MTKYRKKSVEVEALQWTGYNRKDIEAFCPRASSRFKRIDLSIISPGKIAIDTPEGLEIANIGDYVIRVAEGRYYPCKSDIFEELYEKI